MAKRDERGAALVLAIVFVFAIGLVLAAITTFAGSTATSTYNLRQIRSSEINAENLVTTAIPQIRTNPTLCTSSGSNLSATLFCTQTTQPFTVDTRTVDLYACPTSTTSCGSSAVGMILHATVVYDDVLPSNPSASQCSGANRQTCGVQVDVKTWDVRSADT